MGHSAYISSNGVSPPMNRPNQCTYLFYTHKLKIMKSIFEKNSVDILTNRIAKIESNSQRNWGKMTPFQMVKHCVLSEEMYLGMTKYKRLFIGRIFGKLALRSMVKDETPMKKNEPTHPSFKIKSNGDLEQEKEKWINLLYKYNNLDDVTFSSFIHPFFGKMDKGQIGIAVYKHTDHHLRQFGV